MAPFNENIIVCIDLDPCELYDEHANGLLDRVYLLSGAVIENISMCEVQLGSHHHVCVPIIRSA